MVDEKTFQYAVRLLAALALPGIGAKTVEKAIDSGGDPFDTESFLVGLADSSSRVKQGDISIEDYDRAIGGSWDRLEFAKNDGQRIIPYGSDDYPVRLRELVDPPLLLFCKGNASLLNETLPAVAVVGSRKAGEYGLRISRRFGEVLAESGSTVISGLAVGCDASAHEGCLEQDGSTIAVLPSSLDRIVPEQNRGLADRIVSRRGLLVSEQPPDSRIDKSSFVLRNRIQAALSDKVIIVETSANGGTMRTAEFAKKLKRPLGAYLFPEAHKGPDNEGNTLLIDEGTARPLSDSESIASFLNPTVSDVIPCDGDQQMVLPL